MKKLLLLIFLIISGFLCNAQLEVKEGSFKEVTGFVNINTEKMTDDNDQPYAVLKVRTENIDAKQRQELSFKGDARTFFAIEHKDGEVWVYLSYYASYIKISHPDLSSTEFRFPFEMDPKKGYELTLVNKKTVDEEKIISLIDERIGNSSNDNDKKFGYIIINTSPVDGATVFIDGVEMEMKTPFFSDPIIQGPHKIKVIKESYKEFVNIINLDKDEVKNIDITLESTKQITNPSNSKTKKPQNTELVKAKGWGCKTEIGIGYFVLGNNNIEDYPTHYHDSISSLHITSHNDYYYGSVNFQMLANVGYQFTPKMYVGLGLGLNLCKSLFSLPIYLNGYFDLTSALDINIKLGYLINLNSVDQEVNIYSYAKPEVIIKDKLTGTFGSIGFGYNYKKSRFGFEVSCFEYATYMKITTYGSTVLNTTKDSSGISFTLRYGYRIH